MHAETCSSYFDAAIDIVKDDNTIRHSRGYQSLTLYGGPTQII